MTRTLAEMRTEDILDSRDIIERIAELELDDISDSAASAELATLREFAAEAGGYAPDWEYGETLIRDSYFRSYAQEFAEDNGAIDPNASWPMNCIDWEQAARDLQMDYTSVEVDGVTYWIR